MDAGTISEAEFLLTELQYTLGQLHVQLADLSPEARKSVMCGDRSVEQVLADLTSSESRYQSQYARLSKVDPPDEVQTESHIALPVDDSVEQPGSQTTFETMRTQTIEMLRSIGNAWPQELVDLVTRQVREDRVQTTQLAECRKQVFNEASQPELDEPLTSDPQPHQLAGDGTAASEKQGDPATSQ